MVSEASKPEEVMADMIHRQLKSIMAVVKQHAQKSSQAAGDEI
jgi:hypothetical protein